MLCSISDLFVEVPATGGMASRCRGYAVSHSASLDIQIREEQYRFESWPALSFDDVCYMESGRQFYAKILRHNGFMLHASAVELDGRAYLFSGNSGTGKSTHTRLWQQVFGEKAKVFNDDKPALRRLDDRWYAYGTPWCGKDGININMKVPLAGICFLRQADRNHIREMTNAEVLPQLLMQTLHQFKGTHSTTLLLEHLDHLIREIPIFELENRPEPAAARLSYETMRRAAEEAGL